MMARLTTDATMKMKMPTRLSPVSSLVSPKKAKKQMMKTRYKSAPTAVPAWTMKGYAGAGSSTLRLILLRCANILATKVPKMHTTRETLARACAHVTSFTRMCTNKSITWTRRQATPPTLARVLYPLFSAKKPLLKLGLKWSFFKRQQAPTLPQSTTEKATHAAMKTLEKSWAVNSGNVKPSRMSESSPLMLTSPVVVMYLWYAFPSAS
mmetsp:Transcript_8555/g.19981  ORF Transcript_8555/g.19981 Transcript_8555/m.19981 type:complete len:209 (-) Transcript_8555:919-1545(-)